MTPIRMSEEAGMNKTVFAKRTAVDVIVVKPKRRNKQINPDERGETTDHQRGGTKPPST